jgi:D-serine deaminase-like pyridoxal phosphate-dependent protein
VGVQGPAQALSLAREASRAPGVQYRGVMFYPGHLRSPAEEQVQGLSEVNDRVADLLGTLEEGGLTPGIVSGGSTPTLWSSHRIAGVTEVRPGTCIFNDRDILAMGACGREDLAYAVLATVVSTAVPGRAVVDAGSKALAKESFRSLGGGFGFLQDRPEVEVVGLSEEHGILSLEHTDWRPRVGDRVRIIPNHVCVSVNLQDRYVVDTGSGLEAWPIEGRGRGPWQESG